MGASSTAGTLARGSIVILIGSTALAGVLRAAPGDEVAADSQSGLETIVVTAQKRTENIQTVPIAVTAISGDNLRDRQILDVQSLAPSVPNMIFSDYWGETRVTIRGLGIDTYFAQGNESRVASHLDGVYLATPSAIQGTFFDLERAEVLRGPQGTLFGRNAIGGALSEISRDPTDAFEGFMQAELGNYNAKNFEGALSGPLTDNLSGRISFQTKDHDNWSDNRAFPTAGTSGGDNQNTNAVRGKLRYTPNDDLIISLSADYYDQDDAWVLHQLRRYSPTLPSLGELFGSPPPDDRSRDYTSAVVPVQSREMYGASANISYDLGGGYNLVSVTGYRNLKEILHEDTIGAPVVAFPTYYDKVHSDWGSQELRLEFSSERLNWLAGLYYYHHEYDLNQRTPALWSIGNGTWPFFDDSYLNHSQPDYLTALYRIGGQQTTDSAAAFFQGSYELSDRFGVDIGARYTWEDKDEIDQYFQFDTTTPFDPNGPIIPIDPSNPYYNANVTYDDISPKASLRFTVSDTTMAYITYSEGFKSGGFNLGYVAPSFDPETLKNYEIGLKSELFDRRLRLNTTAFYYDYKDVQVSKELNNSVNIENAAAAEEYGIEIEFLALPTDHLQFDGWLALTRAEFEEFETQNSAQPAAGVLDLSGNKMPFVPEYNVVYGVQYTWEPAGGALTLRGEGNTISKVYFDFFNTPSNSEDGYTVLNMFLNWQNSTNKYYGGLFLRNVTNEVRISGAAIDGAIQNFAIVGNYIPPRVYGARFGVRF